MRRWAIPLAGSALFFVFFFFVSTTVANAQAATYCDAAGSGTVDWTPAFENCLDGDTYRIPSGTIVVLEKDQNLANSLEVLGTLDATTGQHALTLTGNKALTITGAGLTFYDLVVNLDSRTRTVDAPNVEVAHQLTVQQGTFKTGLSEVADVEVQVDGTLQVTDTLEVKGNFTNAGALNTGSSRVIFNGGKVQTLTPTATTSFYEVEVAEDTTLEEVHSGDLASAVSVINHGIIRTHRTFPGTGVGLNYGLAGAYRGSTVRFGFISATGLTEIVLERSALTHPTPPPGKTTAQYWKVIPTTPITAIDAVLYLPYNSNELQHPMACLYAASEWDCAAESKDSQQVRRDLITELDGTWAVFEATETTLTLTAAPNPAATNGSVTLAATITPVVSGNVQFYIDNQVAGSPQPLVAGSAEYTANSLSAGSYPVKVKYLGQGLNLPSEKSLQELLEVKYPATIAVVASPAAPVYGEPVTLDATVAPIAPITGIPSGSVTFKANGSAITGCSNMTVNTSGAATCNTSALAVGTQSITAEYGGDSYFVKVTSASEDLEITKAPTTVDVISSHNPAVHGESVTVTATVTAGGDSSATPTGDVTFTELNGATIGCSTTTLVDGKAACTFAATNMDGYAVKADFAENDNFLAGTFTLDQDVGKADSTVLLSAVPASTVYGESVTFTAEVAAAAPGTGVPTETVTFKDGTTVITGCDAVTLNASAVATCTTSTLGAGIHTITADYSGNDEFNPNSDAIEGDYTVAKANTDISVTATPGASVYGESVAFEATVEPVAPGAGVPTTTVTFKDGSTPIAGCVALALDGAAKATCNTTALTVGDHDIYVEYGGNADFNGVSGRIKGSFTVDKAATEVAVASSQTPSVYGESVAFTATVAIKGAGAGSFSGDISFKIDDAPIAACTQVSLTDDQATCVLSALPPGLHTVKAEYANDTNFAGSTGELSGGQQVDPNGTTTVLSSTANPSVYGETVFITATVAAMLITDTLGITADDLGSVVAPTGTVTFTIDSVLDPTPVTVGPDGLATLQRSNLPVGDHAIVATYDGNTNYIFSTAEVLTQTVNVAATEVTVVAGPSPSVLGETVDFTATVAAVAPGAGMPTGSANFIIDGGAPTSVLLDKTGHAVYTNSNLDAGLHSVEVQYVGDANFQAGSVTLENGHTVNKAAVTVTVSAVPTDSSVYAESVTFTATVAAVPPGTGTPTGTVTFKDGSAVITGCDAVALTPAGEASCTTTALGVGDHTITVEYGGNAHFETGSGTLTGLYTVDKAPTEVAVASSHNPSVFGETVTLTASVTSTTPSTAMPVGNVEFADFTAGVIGDCAAVALTDGEATCTFVTDNLAGYSIRARYLGNDDFVSSDGTLNQNVVKADTAVTVTSSISPSVYGQRVTFTATVAVQSPGAGTLTGQVVFKDQGITIASCSQVTLTNDSATCATNLLAVGNHAITAEYVDDEYFADSTGTLSGGQVVDQNGTTTVLASDPNPSVYGEMVFITATVQPVPPPDTFGVQAGGPTSLAKPTGTVDFTFNGVTPVTPVTVDANGMATLQIDSFIVGSHVISATYSGDTNYTVSAAEPITQVVNAAATQTSVVADPSPSVLGQAVTFTATVAVVAPGAGAPTGDVGFSFDGSDPITVSLGKNATATYVTDTLAVGTHSLTVGYTGDEHFQSSSETLGNGHTVEKPDVTVTVGATPSTSVYGQEVTFDAAVAAVPPGTGIPTTTVAFKDGSAAIAGCSTVPLDSAGNAFCTTAVLSTGSHTITVDYGGNAEFNSGSGSLTGGYLVNKAATTVSGLSAPNPSSYGQPVAITATVAITGEGSGNPGGAVSFGANGSAIEGCQELALTAGEAVCNTSTLPVGGNTLQVTYGGDDNFDGSYVELTTQHQVNAATPVVTLTGSPNPSAYLGNVVFTATVSAPSYQVAAGGLGLSVASVEPPTGTVTFDLDGSGYTIDLDQGVATVSTTNLNVGDRPIAASYNATPNYAAAAAEPYTQTVTKANSVTALAVTPNPAYWDDNVVFTATVSYQAAGLGIFKNTAPTGTVTFTDTTGAINLSGTLDQGEAVVNAGQLPPGIYAVVATYVGNDQFTGSTTAPTSLVVQKHASTTTLTSSDNPVFAGGGLNFQVEVAKLSVAGVGIQDIAYPTGTVTITDTTGTLNVSGDLFEGAVELYGGDLTEGTYDVVATYSGDALHQPSTSTVLVQVVKRHRTAATLTVEPDVAQVGGSVSFTVNISDQEISAQWAGPSGEVRYWVEGNVLGIAQASNGQATLIRSPKVAGNYVITATYAGNTVYGPSTTDEAELIVKKRMAAAAVTSSPNPSRLGESVVLTATVVERELNSAGAGPVAPTPTGDVVFFDGDTELGGATLTNGVATLVTAGLDTGTHELKVQYAGDGAFNPATSPAYSHVVQPLPLAVNDAAGTLEGQPVTVAVLANDRDPVGGGLVVITVTQPLSGVVVIDPAGASRGGATVTYTPNPGFAGLDSFSYVAQDANGNTDDGQVAIVVAARQQNGQPSKVAPVDPTQESHAVFTDTHTSVNLVAPVGIYTGTLTDKDVFYLAYTPILTPIGDVNQQPGGMKFGNYVFHLDAFLNGGQLENFQFAQPITLTISYNPVLLGDLQEELLVLYYWNGTTWSSDGITLVSRDTANHTITVRVAHLSEFSFFSAPELMRVILPYISNDSPMHTTASTEEALPAESAPAEGAPALVDPGAAPAPGN